MQRGLLAYAARQQSFDLLDDVRIAFVRVQIGTAGSFGKIDRRMEQLFDAREADLKPGESESKRATLIPQHPRHASKEGELTLTLDAYGTAVLTAMPKDK